MELSGVVPWGRSLSEYRKMFLLSCEDLRKEILGCSDGPASFNAELSQKGGSVISVDPIYQFSANQIRSRIEEVYPKVIEQALKNRKNYIWKDIPTIESLGKTRMDAMSKFLTDYEKSKNSGRYVSASLPYLPFKSKEFEIAICSHYLFLYSDHVSYEQHVLSMKELCRVAREIRVYPLISISDNQESSHLKPVISELEAEGIDVSLVRVDYEFQKGAKDMLVAKRV